MFVKHLYTMYIQMYFITHSSTLGYKVISESPVKNEF